MKMFVKIAGVFCAGGLWYASVSALSAAPAQPPTPTNPQGLSPQILQRMEPGMCSNVKRCNKQKCKMQLNCKPRPKNVTSASNSQNNNQQEG